MKKQITKTIETGKATIEITMTYYNEMTDLDGYVKESKEIAKLVEAKLIANGKVIETTSEGFIYPAEAGKGRFGNIYITVDTVNQILSVIAEMHIELSKAFEIKTLEQKQVEKEIEKAMGIIAEYAVRETEILSEIDEEIWRKNYNNLNNEGGEGYIPSRATLEDIERAKSILA